MLNIQLNAPIIAIPRRQWVPIGAALSLLLSCGVALAYLPETSRAPIGSTEFGSAWAQTFGLLWSGVAAIAALSLLFPAFTRKKMTVRHEADGSIVTVGDAKFMVMGDGTTYDKDRQLAAFQFPDIAFRWQVWHFFRTRPALLPSLLIAVTLMGISWLLAATAMPGTNPYAEHGLWLFPMLSKFFVLLLNCIGVALLLLLVLVGFGPAAVGAIAQEVRNQRALPASESQSLLGGGQDIDAMFLPDRYLFQRPSETSEQFADRIVSERAEHGATNYVVIIAPQNDTVVVACPAGTDNETALQVDEPRTYFVPNTSIPFDETPEQYYAFIQAAAKPLKRWLSLRPEQKHGQVEKLLVSLARPAVRYAATLLFLCFAVSGFGQSKSARLDAYMGDRHPVISRGVEVLFSFQEGTIRRTGDGKSTVQQLLPAGLAFSNADNAGELKEVFINGSKVAPAPRVVASADLGQGSAVPVAGEMLDSASTQRRADAIAIAAEREGRKFLGVACIYWNMVIRILDIGFFAFIGIAGLLRFITNVMNNESRLSIHGGTLYGGHFARIGAFTRFWLAMFVVAGLVTLAIAIFARLSIGDIAGVLTMFFCWKSLFVGLWLGVLYLLERVADRIISNPITDSRPTDFNQPGVQTRRQIPGQF